MPLKSTIEFVQSLRAEEVRRPGYLSIAQVDFDVDCFLEALEPAIKVAPCRSGLYSYVCESEDRANPVAYSNCVELHTDGLYNNEIPSLCILYCLNPGDRGAPTVFADTRAALRTLNDTIALRTINQLEAVYDFGDREVVRGLISDHPSNREKVVYLASNAYVRPQRNASYQPTLQEIVAGLRELYEALKSTIVLQHAWKPNDLIVFDNHSFLHGRAPAPSDVQRRLLRIWLSEAMQGAR